MEKRHHRTVNLYEAKISWCQRELVVTENTPESHSIADEWSDPQKCFKIIFTNLFQFFLSRISQVLWPPSYHPFNFWSGSNQEIKVIKIYCLQHLLAISQVDATMSKTTNFLIWAAYQILNQHSKPPSNNAVRLILKVDRMTLCQAVKKSLQLLSTASPTVLSLQTNYQL